MQEKRNIRLLISLVVLIGITVVAYAFNSTNRSTKVNKDIFRVNDLKVVDRFIFKSKSETVELKYTSSRWLVNNKYEADRNLVDVLFATLQQVEPKRPIATSINDSVSNALINDGIKVSLFVGDEGVKTFYAGGNSQKTQAYFKNENDETPYIMVIPGYRIYAAGVLELDENGWRDKRIFNFNWRNFKNLSSTFSNDVKQNFNVSFVDKYFTIEGLAKTDTTKLNNYLDAISFLSSYQFINKGYSTQYDSLANTQPSLVIEIKDVADRSYRLAVFQPLKNDPYVLGKVGENEELALFQRQTIVPLVKGKEYFRQNP